MQRPISVSAAPPSPNRKRKLEQMTKSLLAFAGAAFLSLAANTLAFASPAADAWVAETRAAFEASLAEAGLADDGRAVALRVTVSAKPDGATLRIVRSSGSQDFDSAAKAAAAKADLKRAPAELVGRTVTFTLGDPAAGPSAAGAN